MRLGLASLRMGAERAGRRRWVWRGELEIWWAVKLSEENGGFVHTLGVASDACREFTETQTLNLHPEQVWFFQNDRKSANGHCGEICSGYFDPGDVVTVELERRHGRDGALRVRIAGRSNMGRGREITGLPRDGMLYPVVGLHSQQSYTMLELP